MAEKKERSAVWGSTKRYTATGGGKTKTAGERKNKI